YCCVSLSYLPSFPTRRSSDLLFAQIRLRIGFLARKTKTLEAGFGWQFLWMSIAGRRRRPIGRCCKIGGEAQNVNANEQCGRCRQDRKSTRLNSSHVEISYAVF